MCFFVNVDCFQIYIFIYYIIFIFTYYILLITTPLRFLLLFLDLVLDFYIVAGQNRQRREAHHNRWDQMLYDGHFDFHPMCCNILMTSPCPPASAPSAIYTLNLTLWEDTCEKPSKISNDFIWRSGMLIS